MARAANKTPLRSHPAIDATDAPSMLIGGHVGPAVKVACPHCNRVRWIATRTLRRQLRSPRFTGSCRPCWSSLPKARTFRTSRNPSGRRIDKSGYVNLFKNAIADEDLDMYVTMRLRGGFVLEHRWNMAKHLGRALTSAECVDHMNGNKSDNSIANLRLYVRGKQQPGSCPGHGTYYHEWQMALRRIEELESHN